MTIAYLNGQYLPLSEARVPVLDRGYLFGDGVYEVIPAYAGQIFRMSAHLQRLDQSLAAIRLANPLSQTDWQQVMAQLLIHNDDNNCDQVIYLQVSRGVSATRAHGLPSDPNPSVLAFTWPLITASEDIMQSGVSAVSREDFRWHRCDIKAIALLANVMLADEAQRDGHNEAILHRDGQVTEGASSNVFAVISGQLITPPESPLILHGITRAFILELAEKADIACVERALSLDELRTADELLISSSTREIYPVTELDGSAMGTGKPGPVWRQLFDLYQQHKRHC